MKVLIVLDDVSKVNQLDSLIGNGDWFAPGSRIIITSRDLEVHNSRVDELYEVKGLCYNDALQLFSLKAFMQRHPPLNYTELSKKMVNYGNGIPLALKILASHLWKRFHDEWESAWENLRQFPDSGIMRIIELSYGDLEKNEKDIFLNIACFFKGYTKDRVENILDARWGIIRLVDKCLIAIVNDKLEMHDLIQDIGWDIANRNGSRLRNFTDIFHILANNKKLL
ncbi:conserved hypothetical protein [Ricinus communis]|uniref:Uncharacterized protein n=1 Tax=Ricinus communis TaxID=3988 RepID=B9SBT9_RICCO|nr:conserved hypothetical protein [Ricinus communis]